MARDAVRVGLCQRLLLMLVIRLACCRKGHLLAHAAVHCFRRGGRPTQGLGLHHYLLWQRPDPVGFGERGRAEATVRVPDLATAVEPSAVVAVGVPALVALAVPSPPTVGIVAKAQAAAAASSSAGTDGTIAPPIAPPIPGVERRRPPLAINVRPII